ncbi:MAG: CpaF family protein, partial [Bdellovibrionales bacterium]|nr:CpaF family protein [Bdellovibrionales bacterium]
VRASLRMRPDRIIVGEIRGGEALDLLQAMNTGHSGSKATVHASSPLQALTRLETLALFSGLEIPVKALREQVSSAIDFVIQASRLPDHSRKITHISEVLPLSTDGSYQVEDVFRFVHSKTENGRIVGSHQLTGYVPSVLGEMRIAGMEKAVALFEQ